MATPPDFVAGNVLTAAQMNAIGLWLVKTQTIGAGVSSVTVSDAFSADYEHYRIMLYGGVGSTAQGINLQLGASTASYYFSSITVPYASDTTTYNRTNNGANFNNAGISTTDGNSLDCNVYSPFATTRTGFSLNGRADVRTTGNGGIGGSGYHNVAGSYTAFTLTVAGTLTGGTIYVYGFRD